MFLFLILFLFVSTTNLTARADKPNKIRESTITFSSGYFEKNYTNRQIGIFSLEMMELFSKYLDYTVIYDKYSENSKGLGLLLKSVSIFVNTTLILSLNSLYHENGHGLRHRAFGKNYILPGSSQKFKFPHERKKDENYFKSFFTLGPVYDVFNFGCPSVFLIDKESRNVREKLISIIGGINNQTYLSEITSNKLHNNGNIGISEFTSYLFSVFNIITYSLSNIRFGDTVLMEKYYREIGVKANRHNLAFSYTLSTLISGTTYSFINMFSEDNDKTVHESSYTEKKSGLKAKPIEFKGFRMPDVFSYINTRGISYKVVSGYSINNNFKLLFGTEFIGHGKFANEFNLGFMKSFFLQKLNSKIIFEILTFFGQGFNIELLCSIPFFDRLSFNFGGGSYSNKSLHGERHSMDLRNINGRNSDIFVSLSYRY